MSPVTLVLLAIRPGLGLCCSSGGRKASGARVPEHLSGRGFCHLVLTLPWASLPLRVGARRAQRPWRHMGSVSLSLCRECDKAKAQVSVVTLLSPCFDNCGTYGQCSLLGRSYPYAGCSCKAGKSYSGMPGAEATRACPSSTFLSSPLASFPGQGQP